MPVVLTDANGKPLSTVVGNGVAGTADPGVVTVQGIASGTPVIVSGTVTANAGTNLNTSALATSAKQPALGTAGTASADVITVQGIASMTPVLATVSQATASSLNATVVQGTAANLKATVVGAGSAGTADAGVVSIQGIASMTPVITETSATLAVAPLRVAIAASSSGDNAVIAAVSSKKTYVYAFELSFSGTVNAKFTDGASGTNLGGLYYGVANAGAANSVQPPYYLFVTSTNTALELNLSGATAVGGGISYWQA